MKRTQRTRYISNFLRALVVVKRETITGVMPQKLVRARETIRDHRIYI